ncbi:MAG: SDR family NAD(P)-dependent oxidoreductase [Planctomycetota bacterium]
MIEYASKNVVVTGGAGALGSAVVECLLETGAHVAVPLAASESPDRCSFKTDDRVSFVEDVDLADEASARSFYERVSVDGLWGSVHIAGGFDMAPLEGVTTEQYEKLFRMNALTCLLSCREAARCMRATGEGGRIVNVAARAGWYPEEGANMSVYAASKAAVVGLTLSLAAELKGDHIWVNAVAPSIMDTSANRRAMPDADHSQWPSTADVARTICFLASPENRSTRAAVVPVYGKS